MFFESLLNRASGYLACAKYRNIYSDINIASNTLPAICAEKALIRSGLTLNSVKQVTSLQKTGIIAEIDEFVYRIFLVCEISQNYSAYT